jgi:hypothetical protein
MKSSRTQGSAPDTRGCDKMVVPCQLVGVVLELVLVVPAREPQRRQPTTRFRRPTIRILL